MKLREALDRGMDIPLLELPTDEELFRRRKTDRDFLTAGTAGLRLVGEADLTGFVSTAARPTNPGHGGLRPPNPRAAPLLVGKLRNRDFNAAINILTLLEANLKGEELCWPTAS